MARPRKNRIILSDENVARLNGLLKKKDTSQTICNRRRILLDLDENHPPVLNINFQNQVADSGNLCLN